jgi:hypothetical protein
MMLDKGQIKDWDGEPEANPAAAPKPVAVAPAEPANDTAATTAQQAAARKRRGQWLALGLFAFVILIFLLTMTKMGANILVRDL